MANVTDPQEGLAWPTADLGQVVPSPDTVETGQPPVNQVIINDAAGTGLAKGGGGYNAAPGGQFGVHLAAPPPSASPATVTVGTLFGQVVCTPATLTFTNANYATDQIVTVSQTSAGDSQVVAYGPGMIRANMHFQ